jgi:hypothetical protein
MMSQASQEKKRVIGGLAAAALAGVLGLFWATGAGIGVSPDTVQYLDCAENMASGKGYTTSLHNYYHPLLPAEFIRAWRTTGAVDLPRRPEIQFPPFYPLLLTALGKLGLGGLAAARGLALFFFGFNIFWTGRLAYRYTGKKGWTALAVVMAAAAEGMLDVHSSGYSEPLFIALILIGLTCLSDYLESGRLGRLFSGAAVMGAAYGVKYTAGMFIAASAASLLFLGPGRPGLRIRRAAVFSAVACVLPTLITVRNIAAGGDIANRIPGLRNVAAPYLTGVGRTLASWAAPGASRFPVPASALALLGFLAALLFFVAMFACARGGERSASAGPAARKVPVLFLAVAPLYVILFLATATFLDENLIPDTRLYAPVFPAAVLAAAVLLDRAFRRLRPGRPRKIFAGLAAAYGALYLLAGAAGLWLIHRNGRGYGGEFWRRPDVVAAVAYVRACPGDLIFSNDDTAVHFFTRRYAYFTPLGPRLGAGPEMADALRGVPAVFVYWKNPGQAPAEARFSAAGPDAVAAEAARILNLRPVLTGPGVSVFRTQ